MMPQHLVLCHLFISRSKLDPGLEDDRESRKDDVNKGTACNLSNTPRASREEPLLFELQQEPQINHSEVFILDDHGDLVHTVFSAICLGIQTAPIYTLTSL